MADPETRARQYGDGGQIFAVTATELGYVIPPHVTAAWSDTMVRLSVADDLSEQDPSCLDPEELLVMLGLGNDRQLHTAAANLLSANLQSTEAHSIRQHFRARREEALCSADLLRFQSPPQIMEDAELWDQLGGLAVMGIHLDSLIDAREDARQLPQFTARQLAQGAFTHLFKATKEVRSETLAACARAIKCLDLYPVIGKRLLEKAF